MLMRPVPTKLEWYLQTCSKAINYRIFKYTFGFEDYFNILDENDFLVFWKSRTINHRLPIECSRWHNLERETWKCNLCNSDIGDEFHYIPKYPFVFKWKTNLY
jgi:hypothetical protein